MTHLKIYFDIELTPKDDPVNYIWQQKKKKAHAHVVDAWITSSCVVNHNTQQVKARQWWWGERNKFKMRCSAHGERKRRLFIHGLNLKLRWHRKERTICCWLPPFEKDDGCSRTHMKSLFYQSELIRRISSDTKQKRHENASTTNITLDHFGVHISSSTLV